jgi:hypothetical protein
MGREMYLLNMENYYFLPIIEYARTPPEYSSDSFLFCCTNFVYFFTFISFSFAGVCVCRREGDAVGNKREQNSNSEFGLD